jgi:hypothetical protein
MILISFVLDFVSISRYKYRVIGTKLDDLAVETTVAAVSASTSVTVTAPLVVVVAALRVVCTFTTCRARPRATVGRQRPRLPRWRAGAAMGQGMGGDAGGVDQLRSLCGRVGGVGAEAFGFWMPPKSLEQRISFQHFFTDVPQSTSDPK